MHKVAIFPISPDVFHAGENGSPADNGLGGLLEVDPFDTLKWATFSPVNGDPGDGDEEGGGGRVVAMSPILTPPHKEHSPTGKYQFAP